MIRIVIADDHEVVRRGLRMTIQGEEDMELIGEATSGQEAVALVGADAPDVALLDVRMPDGDGIDAARAIHAAQPQVAILMLSSFGDDAPLFAALRAGALGYLLKDASGDALVAAIRGAARGEPQLHPNIARRLMQVAPVALADPLATLTPREREVLGLLGRGLSNKEIGATLTLTEITVKGYVSTVLDKLQVADRTQAALLAVRYGLVDTNDLPSGNW
jgi:two-component system, NarL family, response regulator LiaR